LSFIRPGKHFIQVEPFWLTADETPKGTSVLVERIAIYPFSGRGGAWSVLYGGCPL
jgi:hypothetical protein